MNEMLKPGLTFEFQYHVPEDKTVPHLFPEIPEGQVMPKVFASGFMIGLFEFACIQAINPYINWPEEQTVGIGFNLSHTAATPPGFLITVRGRLEKADGNKLTFSIEADDGVDTISKGTHERFIVSSEKFKAAVAAKAEKHLT
ncbi:thioesterase [Desulfonema ishimotonii]|uniref:Thioesterase n=1 Tax=Desulfonema ishimotonii TaxID=45657 RepID=A0A401FXI9_9BACT|nr:thioesterase family protein [Desulfonema ishimotonii]GBC61654.1 thioesterase [Desulfonema ishimotonii]